MQNADRFAAGRHCLAEGSGSPPGECTFDVANHRHKGGKSILICQLAKIMIRSNLLQFLEIKFSVFGVEDKYVQSHM